MTDPELAERIMRRVVRAGECQLWQGAHDPDGYGIVKVAGRVRRLTRLVWELHHGPIPGGLSVLHSCDSPSCVRIDHLMIGSQRANIQDMLRKGRRPKHRVA